MSLQDNMNAVAQAHTQAQALANQLTQTTPTDNTEPFKFIGKDSAKNYTFYTYKARGIERFNRQEMTKVSTLIELTADKEYWEKLGIELTSKGALEAFCLYRNLSDSLSFEETKIKKEGFWNINGTYIYNTGKKTFTASKQTLKEINGEYENHYFIKGSHLLPLPHKEIQADHIGNLFLDYCQQLDFTEKHGAELFAGALIHGLIGGSMSFRVHAIINARAGSGKTQIWKNIKELFGNLGDYQTSSTGAGLRKGIDRTSLPVIFDEAKQGENRINKKNGSTNALEEFLDIARNVTANDEGRKQMATGTDAIKFEYFRSPFMFFCISSPLESTADKERWLEFEIDKPQDDNYTPRDNAFIRLQESWHMGKFITRLLNYAPIIQANIKTLKTAFKGGRRSDVFSTILACRHIITSTQPVTQNDIERYKQIMEESQLAKEETYDEISLLNHILEYRPETNGRNFKEMLIKQRDIAHGNSTSYGQPTQEDPNYINHQETTSYGLKISIKDQEEYLCIDPKCRDIKKAAQGALGQDDIGKYLLRIPKAIKHKCRISRGENPKHIIAIPIKAIFSE